MRFVTAGFNPLTLSPALWFDAADASTLFDATTGGSLVAPDGSIARWEDKSGNARHATQGTVLSRPQRKTSIQNGRDVVRFDGTNDFLVHTLAINGGNHTTFVVGKRSGGASWGYFFQAAAPSQSVSCWIFARSNVSTQWGTFIGGSYRASGFDAASFCIMQAEYNGTAMSTRHNGGSLVTNTGAIYTGDIAERRVIGGYSSGIDLLNGDIAEIISFTSVLSASDRAQVERYLASKWST